MARRTEQAKAVEHWERIKGAGQGDSVGPVFEEGNKEQNRGESCC